MTYYYVQYDMFYVVVVIFILIHVKTQDDSSLITDHSSCLMYVRKDNVL